jgi:hypothetical protein
MMSFESRDQRRREVGVVVLGAKSRQRVYNVRRLLSMVNQMVRNNAGIQTIALVSKRNASISSASSSGATVRRSSKTFWWEMRAIIGVELVLR